jgi:PAS domain S-box-containing protein
MALNESGASCHIPISEEFNERNSSAILLMVGDSYDYACKLFNVLLTAGYTVQQVNSGSRALEWVNEHLPDLILLDTQLPQMEGYDLCCQLKSSASTQDIPVIFLGISDYMLDKAKAFSVGGADYITHPFHAEEVLARVQSQITLYRQRQQLKHQNALLQQEIQERHQIELALRQAEIKYRSIFENANEGIFQTTIDGRYLSVNPALAQIYGYDSPEELMNCITNVGQQLYVQPKRRAEINAYLRMYGRISEAESKIYRKDGSTIWVSENIWIVRDAEDEILHYEGTVQDISDRHRMETELRHHRRQAERLLINILPYQIAHRLKSHQQTIADSFDDVTVLFADLVDFTAASSQVPARELVSLLNDIFSAFDQLAENYGLEKIKTIGDAYMAAAGLPTQRRDHADAAASMALEMQRTVGQFTRSDGSPFQLRIGINTGAVVAGVIGIKKFSYDLWGDTVNIASRMESTGEAGLIQVTQSTYNRLEPRFRFQPRGRVLVKGRGEMMTYWLIGRV